MNIPRYILPTSFAAAVHVALFLALPGEPWTAPGKIIEVILPPWPKPPDDPVVMPVNDPEKSIEPVKSLGGPTPPELPEPEPPMSREVTIPLDPRPINPVTAPRVIPKTFGPGEIGLPGPGDFPRTGIYSPGELDRVPSVKVQITPDYPPALRHSGTTGFVKVEFDVDTAGRVTGARVRESSHREFEDPTLRAVRKWRFEPGKRNGRAVPFRIIVPIEFGLATN